ncbi:Cobalamin biosynthesis protein CobD [Andreprevotia sp. IGB-42]|uniref:adenosylcobinamide-phosphate synthase CbiB n=1 Tax=Andreprevotia sp. IGB-42 TaxID=2497473 RepID=UPI00135C2879|nr:adenosylcobinamide-phosphate synthase CbiB [Andreprevotia sp. IGB-42]KAF0813319.1 Cobalamin biosynthesis protein CobD [Andreprevotia sp. IGB-42]
MLSITGMCMLAWTGVLIDRVLGEPARWHPLVGFGRIANALERRLNPDHVNAGRRGMALPRLLGVLAWVAMVVIPAALAVLSVQLVPWPLAWALHALLLWFALGARSLDEHIRPIAAALLAGDLVEARRLTARIVSRDMSDADAPAVARAAIESALENGNDAIFGALFWFALAGGPGALAFRLANTLDAMWGYRTPRLLHFGWAAARIDDGLNWLPARLTALAYALCGNARSAWRCWRRQARAWDSPNAGPVMASGAGSLQVLCGGAARYHGAMEARPVLGMGAVPDGHDVRRAINLVQRALYLWLGLQTLLGLAVFLIRQS